MAPSDPSDPKRSGDGGPPEGGAERPASAADVFGKLSRERRHQAESAKDEAAAKPAAAAAPPKPPAVRIPAFAAKKPPTLEVPKGGGAIRGLGETYRTNPATGTAHVEIPLPVTPLGRGPLPALALQYDSGGGQGIFGIGWSLSLPAIRRKTDRGVPRYREQPGERDAFAHDGEGELVEKLDLSGTGPWGPDTATDGTAQIQRYRARSEGGFSVIERRRDTVAKNVQWRTVSRDNVTTTYGTAATSQIREPSEVPWAWAHVGVWLADKIEDDRGNVVTLAYATEDLIGVPQRVHERARRDGLAPFTNRYPKRIRYGNTTPGDAATWTVELVFDYGDHDAEAPESAPSEPWTARPDPFSDRRFGFEVRTYRLCRRVLVFHRAAALGEDPVLVRMLELDYDASPVGTRLASARLVGVGTELGATAEERVALPAMTFGYSARTEDTTPRALPAEGQQDLPARSLGVEAQWVDLEGDGLPGVLMQMGGSLRYKRNLGGGALARARQLPSQPAMSADPSATQLTDVDGTGQLAMLSWSGPTAGYHAREPGDGWGPFQTFPMMPNVDLADPQVKLVDLDGDGLDDVVLQRGRELLYFRSKGREGYELPRRIPLPDDETKGPVFTFGTGRVRGIFFADVTGDGLADLVQVTERRIAYWPALGHGKFGPMVVMDHSPVLAEHGDFDASHVRFADLDGTGPADLLYFGVDGPRVYRNLSGNGWGPAIPLPGVHALAGETAQTIDLFGRGTTCITYAYKHAVEAPLRYVDLQAGNKPNLLTEVDNGLGRTVRFEYAASTKFALADRKAGRPWATRLGFPVQVVARMESYDGVRRARTTTTYAYHHGYYDGEEREFGGFGYVEQWDAERFDATEGKGLFPDRPPPENGEYATPPSYTRTWFHTGAWLERATLEAKLAEEWWQGDMSAPAPPELTLPAEVRADPTAGASAATGPHDRREAVRALRGAMLRREVYGLDGSEDEGLPAYSAHRDHPVRGIAITQLA